MSAVGAQIIEFVVLFSRHHLPFSLSNIHSPNSFLASNGARNARTTSKSIVSSSRPAVSLLGRGIGSPDELCWLEGTVKLLESSLDGPVLPVKISLWFRARGRELEQGGRRPTLLPFKVLVFVSAFLLILPELFHSSDRVSLLCGERGGSGFRHKNSPESLSHLWISEIDV